MCPSVTVSGEFDGHAWEVVMRKHMTMGMADGLSLVAMKEDV